jgi:hypothetical protein
MTKDPAFLFYYQDFAYGTRRMTFEEKGAYIELLCEQADLGHLSLDDIKRILKDYFHIWDSICSKFSVDEEGKYYNEVLEEHVEKRRKYTESRRKNLKKPHKDSHISSHKNSHMEKHMVNVNTNTNVNENKDVNKSVNGNKKEGSKKLVERKNKDVIKEIVTTWNFFAENYKLPKVIKITPQRRRNILNRLKEKEFNLEKILREIEKSNFLLGRNNDWRIDFDFIIGSKNNYIKILEGKYRNSNNGIYSKHITHEKLKGIAEDIANDKDLVRNRSG